MELDVDADCVVHTAIEIPNTPPSRTFGSENVIRKYDLSTLHQHSQKREGKYKVYMYDDEIRRCPALTTTVNVN